MARKPKVEKAKSVPPRGGKLGDVEYRTEDVELSTLKPHPRNYKGHPPDQVAHIVESLKQFGIYRNIVVAREGTILAGHGVVLGLTALGRKTVPVRRMDLAPDDPRAMKILALDNELGKFGEDDDRALSEILKEIRDRDKKGLLGTGYDDKSLAAFLMVTRPASEIRTADEAAEWVGMPEYDPGGTPIRLVITFPSEKDRKAFLDEHEIKVVKQVGETWSARWPTVENEDTHSLKFASR